MNRKGKRTNRNSRL